MEKEQNDVKVSIIMPVYNTAPYLRQCLDSVQAQTLKEFELICVDDGSTDGSLEILQQYAEKDSRIIVKHQENMGPAIARNNAISIARGQYIAFMDGDDLYPENSILENLFNAAEQSGCKIAGGYKLILRTDGSIREENEKVYKYITDNLPEGGVVKYSKLQTDFNYQCYIYSHELLEKNKITFPDYRRFQDPPFFVKAMITAGNIYLIPIPTYVYRWGQQNINWNLRKKKDLLLGHIDVLSLACDYNLNELYLNVINRLAKRNIDIFTNNFSFDSLPIYLLCIELYTINTPATLSEDRILPKLNLILTSLENEMIKVFNQQAEDEIISFIEKVFDKCTDKSVKIYCTVTASLLRIISGLRNPTAALRFEIIGHYIKSADNLAADIKITHPFYPKLQNAINWYKRNQNIQALNDELQCTKTAPPIEEQGTVTVSVIIPVYNTEAYLSEALNSIVNQTLKDIEIICVNDGSTDGSAEILEEYAKRDSRISIITQENKGLSCSRNAGIMAAKGKYIYFMDSDDILETTALEELIPVMEEKDLDVLHFDGETFAEDPELITPFYQSAYKRSRAYNEVYEGAELLKLFNREDKYNTVVWLQIFKTSFLRENDIYFIPGILHEDNAFTYSTLLNARRTSHTNKIYFHRRLRENSIMTADTKFENVYGRYVCYWDMLKTYYTCLSNTSEINTTYALQIIYRLLSNVQYEYEKLSDDDSGSELGITDDLYVFRKIVVNSANANKYKKQLNSKNETIKKLKEKQSVQKERNTKLKEKLNNQKIRSKELKEKLNNSRDKNKELKEKLNNAKSKGVDNKELEKYKKENEALRKKLKAARKENKKIKNSRAYKLGRIIMYIPHRIKRLFKK